MMQAANEERYRVVVNNELQYSIWPLDRELPMGWHEDGVEGSKEECLAHIAKTWTDMRPLSVRSHLEQAR